MDTGWSVTLTDDACKKGYVVKDNQCVATEKTSGNSSSSRPTRAKARAANAEQTGTCDCDKNGLNNAVSCEWQKKKCVIKTCATNYELKKNKCVAKKSNQATATTEQSTDNKPATQTNSDDIRPQRGENPYCKKPDGSGYVKDSMMETGSCKQQPGLTYCRDSMLESDINLKPDAKCFLICSRGGWDIKLRTDSCADGYQPARSFKSCEPKTSAAETPANANNADTPPSNNGTPTTDGDTSDGENNKPGTADNPGDNNKEENTDNVDSNDDDESETGSNTNENASTDTEDKKQTDKLSAAQARTAAAKEKREAAEANYKEKKDIEQSKENRLLGAATMAATGVGGMELAQGLAEKKADEAAERDMTAYMATFRCDAGNGQNIKGGTTGIEVPGTAALAPMVAKYKALAADLKQRKEALGLKPGIESEIILDNSTMGLYDDRAMAGERVGAFTSLYRALKDPEGKDAAEWNAQKEKSQKKIKGGAIAVGAGVVGGIAGDLIINRDKDKNKDKDDSDDSDDGADGKCKYPDEDKYADKKDKKTFACVVTDTEMEYAKGGELTGVEHLAENAQCEYTCKRKGWDVTLKQGSCAENFAPDKKNKKCEKSSNGVMTGDATPADEKTATEETSALSDEDKNTVTSSLEAKKYDDVSTVFDKVKDDEKAHIEVCSLVKDKILEEDEDNDDLNTLYTTNNCD